MTRAEALQILDTIPTISEQVDALEMAIQALSQEPCTDAVSRDAILEGLKGCICEEWIKTLFATMVKQLPPVTQKSGKWIEKEFRKEEYVLTGKCSVCGQVRVIDKYCPNCGAKMIEPQERSDKE